jgi:hypothetical protein
MRRRLVIIPVLGLAVGLAWLIWPRHTNDPLLRLKIVRQTVENGKPVVLFRVEVGESRRITICGAERVTGDRVEGPLDFSEMRSTGLPKPVAGFWAASQSSPMYDPRKGWREFGVVAPMNAPVWKLRVRVVKGPSRSERFKQMVGIWRITRRDGGSLYEATMESWYSFYEISSDVIESDLITNTVPPR